MSGIWVAKVRTPLRLVEVEVLSAPCEAAHVRALEGAPFEIIGSKPPYYRLMTDETSVNKADLIDLIMEELPDPVEDQAFEDSYSAWCLDHGFEADDTTDTARASCHW